jgi:hypothetical protein
MMSPCLLQRLVAARSSEGTIRVGFAFQHPLLELPEQFIVIGLKSFSQQLPTIPGNLSVASFVAHCGHPQSPSTLANVQSAFAC